MQALPHPARNRRPHPTACGFGVAEQFAGSVARHHGRDERASAQRINLHSPWELVAGCAQGCDSLLDVGAWPVNKENTIRSDLRLEWWQDLVRLVFAGRCFSHDHQRLARCSPRLFSLRPPYTTSQPGAGKVLGDLPAGHVPVQASGG